MKITNMLDANELWRNANYTAPIDYVINSKIIEYDVAKANISVFLDSGVMTQEEYDECYGMVKQDREVRIGNLIRKNPSLSDVLKRGLEEARHSLFDQLGLNVTNVLAIKSDAVYVLAHLIDKDPLVVYSSPNVYFRVKNEFRSFYRLYRKEFYYNYDPITKKEALEVKGLGDYSMQKHKALLAELIDIFYRAVNSGSSEALRALQDLYNRYTSMQLDIECYRRLDSQACFDLKTISNYGEFRSEFYTPEIHDLIKIDYNANVLGQLAKLYIHDTFN